MAKLRACEVDGRKGYFHKWGTYQNVLPASPMIGGAPAGQIAYEFGIIEYEDGTVGEVSPERIKFTGQSGGGV